MTEVINEVLDFLVEAGPSLTAVLSMVLSVVINIHKQGKLNDNQLKAVNGLAEDLRKDNTDTKEDNAKTRAMCRAVIRENAELKSLLNQVIDTYGPIKRGSNNE
jgi:hypothetical protein